MALEIIKDFKLIDSSTTDIVFEVMYFNNAVEYLTIFQHPAVLYVLDKEMVKLYDTNYNNRGCGILEFIDEYTAKLFYNRVCSL